jgi:hypothetical protein
MGELADYNKESEKKTKISPKQNPSSKGEGLGEGTFSK